MSERGVVDYGALRPVLLAETVVEGASSTLPPIAGCRVDEQSEIHRNGRSA